MTKRLLQSTPASSTRKFWHLQASAAHNDVSRPVRWLSEVAATGPTAASGPIRAGPSLGGRLTSMSAYGRDAPRLTRCLGANRRTATRRDGMEHAIL